MPLEQIARDIEAIARIKVRAGSTDPRAVFEDMSELRHECFKLAGRVRELIRLEVDEAPAPEAKPGLDTGAITVRGRTIMVERRHGERRHESRAVVQAEALFRSADSSH